MELHPEDKRKIRQAIREKYASVAESPEGRFCYPTGPAGLEKLGYPEEVSRLPQEVLPYFCGVGNPFSLKRIAPGDRVLDVGCGAGVDTLLAGVLAGAEGEAAGMDPVPEMIAQARSNLALAGFMNVSFQEASAESIPFSDASFDKVISNGALNLVPDKAVAFSEIFRVLKPGGFLQVADEVLTGDLPQDKEERIARWARWEGGAIPGKVFLEMLQEQGFAQVELVGETGLNSSQVTRGIHLRARKPEL